MHICVHTCTYVNIPTYTFMYFSLILKNKEQKPLKTKKWVKKRREIIFPP